MLKLIGYWSQTPEEKDDMIHPQYLQNSRLQYAERGALATYLKRGVTVLRYLGYSFCRLPGGLPDNEMGARDLSDGVWMWPEGLWVYVARYGVELPQEFVEHAERNGYRIPPDLDETQWRRQDEFEPPCLEFDTSFWLEWCKKKKAQRKHS